MKKLLILVALVTVIAMTLVACKDDKTPAETTGSDVTTVAPEESSDTPTAPEDDTTAPEDDTTVPEDDTTAPEDDTTVTPDGPTNIFDANALIQQVEGTSGGRVTAVVNDNVITYTPQHRDPYYFPFKEVRGDRYLVIKYRTNTKNLNIQFFIASSGSKPSNDKTMMQAPVVSDGEWNLAIFDLSDIPGYDCEFVSYFRFDVLESGYVLDEYGEPIQDDKGLVKVPLPEDATIDVEYVAFFPTEEAAMNYEGN